jgi:hypothetical protein
MRVLVQANAAGGTQPWPEDDRVCPAFLPRARARAGPIPALSAYQLGSSAGLPAARASSVNLRRLAALAR